jgi:hypothetical protein
MISEVNVKKYCRDDISKIENYEQAINDKEHKWVCHHRLEFTINGEFAHTCKELKKFGMYWKRPYFELIFMRADEHQKLHKNSDKFKNDLIKFNKRTKVNNKNAFGKCRSYFSIKFNEHYGINPSENWRLYWKENAWYRKHNKCRWEYNG